MKKQKIRISKKMPSSKRKEIIKSLEAIAIVLSALKLS